MKIRRVNDSPLKTRGMWSSVWVRGSVSLLLALHLVAVVVAPAAVPPSSYLEGRTWDLFQPYLETAYLNHGYHYFAPEPGPSHLLRYEADLPGGERIEGLVPDRASLWPRLFYHRHFMLAERLAPVEPTHPDHGWKETLARSYAEHLQRRLCAERLRLYLRRHAIPYPNQVRGGIAINDPSLYQEQLLVELPEAGR
jgi:hypothetical protein